MVSVMAGSPPSTRRGRWTASPYIDVALALLLSVVLLPSASDGQGFKQPAWAVVALIELTALPLAVRRRWPIPVLAVTLLAAVLGDLLFVGFQLVGPVIAMYTVAAHCERRPSLTAGGATALALTVPTVHRAATDPAFFPVAVYAAFAAAWAVGDGLQSRRAYLAELEARAERLAREQEERARRAAADERARIARELHDVISHNVSVMVVQAAAGGDVFTVQPERAREALASIESTGREALAELRRLLDVVRPADERDEAAALAPRPGLARLAELIEHVTAAGLQVDLRIAGTPREPAPGVDVCAYRIVQEALTNTLKHARASRAEVALRYEESSLELEVVDDGAGADGGCGAGRGLIGMRERAALFGGELAAGPRPDGGFGVRAMLPLGKAGP
jgi:signal transduction histidine kinase